MHDCYYRKYLIVNIRGITACFRYYDGSFCQMALSNANLKREFLGLLGHLAVAFRGSNGPAIRPVHSRGAEVAKHPTGVYLQDSWVWGEQASTFFFYRKKKVAKKNAHSV